MKLSSEKLHSIIRYPGLKDTLYFTFIGSGGGADFYLYSFDITNTIFIVYDPANPFKKNIFNLNAITGEEFITAAQVKAKRLIILK